MFPERQNWGLLTNSLARVVGIRKNGGKRKFPTAFTLRSRMRNSPSFLPRFLFPFCGNLLKAESRIGHFELQTPSFSKV